MQSKTPKSDVLLDVILENLIPHSRVCLWKGKHSHCEGDFFITKEDIEFLKMLRVPGPNFCPTCRRMRRLTHLNLYRLFQIPCEKEGHSETLISVFPKECPFPIWDVDSFSQIDDYYLAKSFDDTKKPIENLFEMRKVFPVPNFLNREPTVVNSPYSSGGRNLKNGYYVFGCFSSEDIWYTNHTKSTRNIMDSRVVKDSEFVYKGFFSDHLYKCSFVYFSKNCTDSMFLYDCRNCTNCFGCVNLRNKSYCIWNIQYSKEEYETWIKEYIPITREFLEETEVKFQEFIKRLPINASCNIQTQDSVGILLENSVDMQDVFDSSNSQHVRHAEGVITHKDSMDFLFSGGNSHHLYMCTNIGSQSSNVKFSISSKYCTGCEFVFNSKNLTNCFMCFGLQNKSYCILNKQYTEEEYFQEVDKIKVKMIELGEYNDGVGMEFSAQAYNFSLGQLAFPLTDEEIKSLGGYVGLEPESNVGNLEVIDAILVPQSIREVTDDILNKAILCPVTKRPFRIVATELEFLRRMELPLPTIHPSERMKENFLRAPEGKMYHTNCIKCFKNIQSLYDPQQNYVLCCEECYRKKVV